MDDIDHAPLFVIDHEIEIAAPADAVWAVLTSFDDYPAWNPYVLALEGALEPGRTLRVTISQTNWPDPLVVEPVLLRVEPDHLLHWHGQVGGVGVLDTDHVFEIQPVGDDRVLFRQYEEFRGMLAEQMDDSNRAFTHAAFVAMNEALAERVTAR